MADWNGLAFRRLLFSAERFNERAIFFGSSEAKTLFSRSSASLVWVTRFDHFFFGAAFFALLFFFTVAIKAFINGSKSNTSPGGKEDQGTWSSELRGICLNLM